LGQVVKEIPRAEHKDYVETTFGNWKLGITRNMSFWHQWMASWGHFHYSKDFGIEAQNQQLAITTDGTHTSIFFRPENVAEYSTAVLNAVETVEGIKRIKFCYKQFADELLISLENLQRKVSIEHWEGFIKNFTRFCAGLFLTSVIGRAGITKLTELLKKAGVTEEKIPETIAIITYPNEHTPLFKSQLDLLEIGAKTQRGISQVEKLNMLKQWLENHGFIPVNFCEDPWTLNDAEQQLNKFLQKDCASELKKFKQVHQNKVKEKKDQLEKIDDEEISVLSQAIAEGTYLNEFRKNVFSRVSLGYRDVFSRIAKLGNSENWRDCFYLLPDEMRSLLEGTKFEIRDIVEKRRVIGFYTDETGVNRFIEEDDLKKFVEFIEIAYGKASAPTAVSEKIVKGFTANKGIIEGVVRIVLSAKDFHKVNSGDILVTTMTSVDFVPIMEKAGAFVTNEGGITSHAAIVAREMNKPCIIGTQIATKILRDGDKVKVDGNRGIVEILN
jgi:phosphohistidine swiveling domain-containing protein